MMIPNFYDREHFASVVHANVSPTSVVCRLIFIWRRAYLDDRAHAGSGKRTEHKQRQWVGSGFALSGF